jgi:hypothetical protein
MKRISQREARLLKKEVERLRREIGRQRQVWCQDYFGTEIARGTWDHVAPAVRVARALKHAVVVIGDSTNELRFVALPHVSEEP